MNVTKLIALAAALGVLAAVLPGTASAARPKEILSLTDAETGALASPGSPAWVETEIRVDGSYCYLFEENGELTANDEATDSVTFLNSGASHEEQIHCPEGGELTGSIATVELTKHGTMTVRANEPFVLTTTNSCAYRFTRLSGKLIFFPGETGAELRGTGHLEKKASSGSCPLTAQSEEGESALGSVPFEPFRAEDRQLARQA